MTAGISVQHQPSRSGARAWRLPDADSAIWSLSGIAIAVLLHFAIALERAINWDEFWHYTQVRALHDGTITQPLQSFYTRFFTWVLGLPGSGVDHIVLLRLPMFACLLAICASIYVASRRFAGRNAALLCVLLYLSAGYVMHHGTSFRFDPMAGALLMGSLAVMLRSRLGGWAILIAAALAGAALLLTIKSVLYAPAFAGVAWLRWREAEDRRAMLARLALLALATVALSALFYLLHSSALGDTASAQAGAKLTNAWHKMFGFGNLPYYPFIPRAALLAPFLAICVLAVPFVLMRRGYGDLTGGEKVALAGLWLPIAALAFYHNTAPYFYVFVLPPVCVACAIILPGCIRRYGLPIISGALAVLAIGIWLAEDDSGAQDKQRTLQHTADMIFTQPVGYFDLAGMLGHHHKMNTFMTPWGTENYLRGLAPSMRATMAQSPVPLVVNNDPMFDNALRGIADPHLLPADAAALHSNYLHFWGPFWLAGKIVPAQGGEFTTEFLVPGPYTVRGGPTAIDGMTRAAGDVVWLDRGIHHLRAVGAADARLIWGDRLPQPAAAPPAEPYWTGF